MRLLYFNRNILHRGISCGNLLYMEKDRATATTLTKKLRINTIFLSSSIYWIRRKSSSIHCKSSTRKSSVPVSVTPSATVSLLVNLYLGEIRDMKGDERRFEGTVF